MASSKNSRDQDRSKPVMAFVMLISALFVEPLYIASLQRSSAYV